MSYSNINNPVNYQLQGFGQNGVRTISIDQLYIQGEYYRVLVAEEDSYVTAVSVLGDDLTAEFVYAGTTIYGLFTAVSVTSGSLTAYIAGPTDIEDVWAYINAYGQTNAATIEAADCAKDAIAPLLDKYYAKASLVMVPSLYKTSIVYSERPLTTSGQLDFTRSNDTATRVGPDGYIEKVRTNLILQSETFGNASWGKSLVTITDNFDTAPNGTLTADRFVSAGGAFPQIAQARTVVSGAQYTASLYVKSDGTTQIAQVIIIGGNTVSFTPTNTWQRITTTFTAASSSATFVLATNSAVAPASSFVIWGAQLETGDIATDYIQTTASAVSVGPVANLPRLNYPINSDGSVGCPSLLLEPQRTNYQVYSENSAQWSTPADGLTVVYNTSETIDPSGYYGAEKVTSASGNKRMFNGLTNPSGALTMSSFVKKGTGDEFLLRTTSGSINVQYNLTTLTITATAGTGTITDYGNGWYRVTASTTSAIANEVARYQFPNADGEYMYFWGAMAENGAYATSYIPTLGAAVTRGADACSKTGISSLIGQTQGTLFVEATLTNVVDPSNIRGILELNDGTTNNRFSIYRGANTTDITALIYTLAVQKSAVAVGLSGKVKIAIGYDSSGSSFYFNGSLALTETAMTYPACSELDLGIITNNTSRILGDGINQVLLFKTRLTNQELQDLTTL